MEKFVNNRNETSLDFSVFNAVFNPKTNHLALQTSTGQVYKYGKKKFN